LKIIFNNKKEDNEIFAILHLLFNFFMPERKREKNE